jgi:hypothetical protein
MNEFMTSVKATFMACIFLSLTVTANAQSGQKWATGLISCSGTDALGTINSFPLIFKTNNTERFRLTETGNFGIGVTNPTHTFEVVGNSLFTGDVIISGRLNLNDVDLPDTISTSRIFVSRISSPDGVIHFGDSSLIFQTGLNRIWASISGNSKGLALGYGTYSEGLNSTSIGFYTRTGSIAENSVIIGSSISSSQGSYFVNNKKNCLMIGFNSDIPTLYVGPADGAGTIGKIGIGTTIPVANLDIKTQNGDALIVRTGDNVDDVQFLVKANGFVYARNVKVKVGTLPDFVFDKEYQLISLDSVENFIKQNKHLPDIPSQSHVLANGLDVGEFNSLLLKKVEELTLYIIDLKKENEQLKERVSKIENK